MKIIIHYWPILLILLLLGGCCYTCKDFYKSNSWRVEVSIGYQYENDSIDHLIKIEKFFSYNAKVKQINPTFYVPGNYVNELYLAWVIHKTPYSTITDSGETFVMKVPDKKFKVTNLTWRFL